MVWGAVFLVFDGVTAVITVAAVTVTVTVIVSVTVSVPVSVVVVARFTEQWNAQGGKHAVF